MKETSWDVPAAPIFTAGRWHCIPLCICILPTCRDAYTEGLEEAVRREAHEELGLRFRTEPRFLFQYIWESEQERELVTSFHIVYNGRIVPNSEEVDEGRFWTYEELRHELGRDVFTQQFEQQEYRHLIRSLCL